MGTYNQFIYHTIGRLRHDDFIFLLPGDPSLPGDLTGEMNRSVDGLNRFCALFRKVAVVGASDDPVVKALNAIKVERVGTGKGDSLVSEMTDAFDFNALKFGLMGTRYIVSIDCDSASEEELLDKSAQFNRLAHAVREATGRIKLKSFGMGVGRGWQADFYGSLCLVTSGKADLRRLRALFDQIDLESTSKSQRRRNFLLSLFINPMVFSGKKGNSELSKALINLSDRSVSASGSPGGWNKKMLMSGYGFSLNDLVP